MTSLYLASASPRRSELLKQIDIKHIVLEVPAAPGEDEPRHPGESPLVYVKRTAFDKAQRAVEWIDTQKGILDPSLPVLTADTTVAMGESVLGKPRDIDEAREILTSLSGKTHLVHTAVVLSFLDQQFSAVSTSQVTFDRLSKLDIETYIASREPFGKAGAYGIQGLAAKFIANLEGSYTGVMGLPLFETSVLIKNLQKN